jgi:hypothetical protein
MTTTSYAIANVYNSTTGVYQATPVTIYFGTSVSGTGNIAVSASSTSVVGYGTSFSSTLAPLYVLRDSSNNFIGRVKSVDSDTAVTLTQPASVGVTSNASPTNFKLQSCIQTPITYDSTIYRFTADPHQGNGTITTSNVSNTITGTSTIFTKQFDVGYQIFANTYAIDGNYESLLGVVKRVYSNTSAEFTTFGGYTLTSTAYRFFDPVTPNAPNSTTQSSMVINNALLQWNRSGLIPGITQVKSYHPPVQDPETGILVNFPATMHTSANGKRLRGSKMTPIDTLDHSNLINSTGKIHNFDADNPILGSSVKKAIDSIPVNSYIKKLSASDKITDSNYLSSLTAGIQAVYGKSAIPSAPGLVFYANAIPNGFTKMLSSNVVDTLYIPYQGPGANVIYVFNETFHALTYPTAADQLAIAGGGMPVPRIVNNRTDANAYYDVADPISNLSDADKADLAARASNQFSTNDRKKVKVTGVPAAIPGLMNVVLMDENPANRKFGNISYDWAILKTNTSNNPDLPISSLNPYPSPSLTIKPPGLS